MRFTISGLVLFTIFLTTPGFSQVKRWIDKDGIVHLEGTGAQRPKGPDSSQPKRNALRPIERNFASLRLGDDESPFSTAKKASLSPIMVMMAIFIATQTVCLRERLKWECSSVPAG